MDAHAAILITTLAGTTTSVVIFGLKWCEARKKMKAEELRTLAHTLDIEARKNIQRGMMNPAAPFARGPQRIIELHTDESAAPVRTVLLDNGHKHSDIADAYACRQCNPPQLARALPAAPAPVEAKPADPVLPAEGTFFWPGLAEEEIKKEREGNG